MRKHGLKAAWRQIVVERMLRQMQLVLISRSAYSRPRPVVRYSEWRKVYAPFWAVMMALAIALPVHAARAVMEDIKASTTTIFVDTLNVRVGISTGLPQTTLDVNGLVTIRGGSPGSGKVLTSNASGQGSWATPTAGDAVLSATQTWSGSNAFNNTVTVSSTLVVASSVTANAFFGNGSALTNLPVAQSSTTRNFTGTTSATSFSVCYATQTITTGGSAPIAVWYNGALRNSGAVSNYCILNVLQDGNYISPYTATQGMAMSINTGSNLDAPATLLRVLPAPSAASHSWCLQLAAGANNCDFSNVSFIGNEFGVVELK